MNAYPSSSFSAWFETAGPEVQAALIGNAGITLAALVTVVGTALFAIRQYRLERKEKARDRALQVKKEILFESVRGGSRALAAFAALTNLEIKVSAIAADFQASLSSVSVASAAANIETVKRGRDFLNEAGPKFIQRAVARAGLDLMQTEVLHIQANLDSQLAENQTLLGLQREAIVGMNEQQAQQANALFQVSKKIFDQLASERDQAIQKMNPAHQDYIRQTMMLHAEMIPTLHAYIAAIRSDIGIDGDDPKPFLDAAFIDPQGPAAVLNDALRELAKS